MAIETRNLGFTVNQIINKLDRIGIDSDGNTEIGTIGNLHFTDNGIDGQGGGSCNLNANKLSELLNLLNRSKIHYGTADPNNDNPNGSSQGDIYIRYSTPTQTDE